MSPIILFFFYLSTLRLTHCEIEEIPTKLSTAESNTTNDGVTETQYATCKIATEELVANARATVTRVLTGACNAKRMEEKFENLEKNITKELNEIKSLLRAILESGGEFSKLQQAPGNERNIRVINYKYEADKEDVVSPRQWEIEQFNNTVQKTSMLNETTNAFIYYWQIKDFDEKLASWKAARSQRSSTFYVEQIGYAMYIKVTPRYFPDGTVFIGVGLTRGRHDSVLRWPFPLKIRLEILDHSPEQLRQDRHSRIWDPSTLCTEYFWGRPKLTGDPDNPECVGLSISRQVLFSKVPSSIYSSRSTKYLWNGNIVIKLIVYF